MSTKISIIVPIYNTSLFLKRCLDSLLGQTFEDIEILMIDDGSTDNSKDICLQYQNKDERFKYAFKSNGGLSSTRNYGIQNATGSYILFLDSDDYLASETCEICYKTAEKNNLELLNFGYQYIKNDEVSIHISKFPKNKKIGHQQILELLRRDTLHNKLLWFSWSYFYKTSFLKDNALLFDESILLGEDSDFNIRCLLQTKYIYSISNALYCYVYNPDSLTQTKYRKQLLEKYISQFKARTKVYKNFGLTDKVYYQDISQNYVEHALFELIYNEKNNPDKDSLTKYLKTLRQTPMFQFCSKNYSFSKNCTPKKKVLTYLFTKNQTLLLSYVLKYGV